MIRDAIKAMAARAASPDPIDKAIALVLGDYIAGATIARRADAEALLRSKK